MPSKRNPLKLNPLQLRTLALLQELTRHPDTATPGPEAGEVTIRQLPHPHGDHVHIGRFVVSARDASGFANPAVWAALARKGLAKADFPVAITLTAAGIAYDTGFTEALARHADH